MARVDILRPHYVQYIPPADSVKPGELYISLEFQTAVHKCCCGCGLEVVTPLNPAQWGISEKNGKISVYPSIGNWTYPCRSHYFITHNRVVWASTYSEAAIRHVQSNDKQALECYIASKNAESHKHIGLLQQFIEVFRVSARKISEFFKSKK